MAGPGGDLQQGSTLFWLAVENGHVDTVRYALECRLEVDQTNSCGAAALSVAAQHGHAEVVSLLLGSGARVTRTDAEGRTALDRAAQNGHAEVVWLLLGYMETGAERFLLAAAEAGDEEAARRLLRTKPAVDEADEDGHTPFFAACRGGHLGVARLLAGAGAAVGQAGNDGCTPLHVAARNGHAEVVRWLLSLQAVVDEADEDGWTPLLAAAEHGHTEIAGALLAAKAAVDRADFADRTPLYVACQTGHTATATLLLGAGAAVNAVENNGRTPLYVAAAKGQAEVARLLLSAQAAVDQASLNGWTPLYAAAKNDHTDMADILLAAQADVDRADNEGCPPLWIACQNGHLAVATLLVQAGAAVDAAWSINGYTSLFVAAKDGHVELARLLLSAQATVDHADNENRTPLWTSCQNGHLAVARLLLGAGAAVNAAQRNGCTPLYVAAEFGHAEVAQLLVSAQATVDQADEEAATPLYIAAHNGHADVARVLLAAQATVDQVDKDSWTPLGMACFKGHLAVAALLWESKADLNHRENDGLTPLFMAAREGFHLVVKWLLAVGADHRLANNKGDTPLWAAVQFQHPHCAEALLEAGADANHRHSQTGQSALMCAAATGNHQNINLLLQYGARQDARDRQGFTVFHHADYTVEARFAPRRLEDLLQASIAADTAALAEVLRDPAVDVNAGDKYLHWTALMEAVLYGSAATVSQLVAHGADPAVPMFCGLTAAFWAELRGDAAFREALGAGVVLSAAETGGLAVVRGVRQRSREAAELLAFDGVDFPHSYGARRRPQRNHRANLSVQDRMADVSINSRAGRFYPEDYQCPVSLYSFLTTDTEKFQEAATEVHAAAGTDAPPAAASEEEMLTLLHMVAEGRKVVAVHVAAPSDSFQPQQRDCPPEDVFALFCYTFESIAYQHSNWAMRHWNRREAQTVLELWRPFIHHCERALQRLPSREGVVYRGIPIGFEAAEFGMGETFVWPAFSSTSELLKVAKNFALQRPKALIFVIKARSGVSIHHCSRYPAEAEVLFPPNLRLASKWLGRQSVLDETDVLLELQKYVAIPGYRYLLEPHQLTTEEAEAENVVVVYCEEVGDDEHAEEETAEAE